MSTAVTLAGDPELLYTRDGKPFLTCRVLVNRRTQNDEGEWIIEEPTPRNVKVYGSAVNRVHGSCGSVDPIVVHGLKRTERWPDKQTGENRTKTVVIVDSRFGGIGVSLKYVSARIERVERPAAQAAG